MDSSGEKRSATFFKLPGKEVFSRRHIGQSIHSILDGTFLTKERFMRALPFIIFLIILGIMYITNIFHVEKTKRQIDDLEEELRELRYEYITSRSRVMFESKSSEIARKLKDTGISESMHPPKKIIIGEKDKISMP
ncbi:MAG: hypothetical protein KBC43_04180 [Bacteroidales bacterium]|nr:hypothetical protein [Bacteroidales bacterium]